MYGIYRIQQGDTIDSLSKKYGVSPEILKNLIDSYGGKDIQIKKLSNSNGNYRHTTPVRLGEAYIKQNQNIEHKPIIITDNEILNFKVNNNS